MVDVGAKAVSHRVARATGSISMTLSTLDQIARGAAGKGDVLGVARIAAIQAAKRTSDLIPLCHPLQLSLVDVLLTRRSDGFEIESRVRTTGPTGVEMEALTAVSVAALTIYDMLKAVDRTMQIGAIRLIEKRGGRSGHFKAAR